MSSRNFSVACALVRGRWEFQHNNVVVRDISPCPVQRIFLVSSFTWMLEEEGFSNFEGTLAQCLIEAQNRYEK